MRIDLPQNVNFIIDTLYEHGFEAYAVGGCAVSYTHLISDKLYQIEISQEELDLVMNSSVNGELIVNRHMNCLLYTSRCV